MKVNNPREAVKGEGQKTNFKNSAVNVYQKIVLVSNIRIKPIQRYIAKLSKPYPTAPEQNPQIHSYNTTFSQPHLQIE